MFIDIHGQALAQNDSRRKYSVCSNIVPGIGNQARRDDHVQEMHLGSTGMIRTTVKVSV